MSLDVKPDSDWRYHLIRLVFANVSHDCLSSLADHHKLLDSVIFRRTQDNIEGHDESAFGVPNIEVMNTSQITA